MLSQLRQNFQGVQLLQFLYMLRRQFSGSKVRGRKMTLNEKENECRSILRLIEWGNKFQITHLLLGWMIGNAGLSFQMEYIQQLKQKFITLHDLYLDGLISADNIVRVAVDAAQSINSEQNLTKKENLVNILTVLTYSLEEILMNDKYIKAKWERQHRSEQQRIKNQQYINSLMEEENRQHRQKVNQLEKQGWDCLVCECEIDRENIGILECGHIFHPECINGYLKSKIESNVVQIDCPMEGCGRKLGVTDIYGYIEGDLKEKYQKFSFNKFVEQNNSSTAWCPTAGCPAVFCFDEQLDNYRCPACKKHYCLRCKCEYHSGMTCAEYRINNSFDRNDEEFLRFVQGSKYKQCPKCKYWVERMDGCSTMSCKCGQQFCYDCGGTTCPHGACANLELRPRPVLPPAARPFRAPKPKRKW